MHQSPSNDLRAASADGLSGKVALALRLHGRNGWTPALRRRFLDRLSAHGNVRAAAASCGLSRASVYKLRARDPLFARDWDGALMRLREELRQELARRGADGCGDPRLAAFLALLCGNAGDPGTGPETPWTP